jgi:hypothetical protein
MTRSTATAPVPDPTLLTLIPRPSRRRNAVLAVAAVVVLVGLWFSPDLLRPSVVGSAGGGSTGPVGAHEVRSAIDLDPHGWPWFTIESVADVPGATVEDAWVIPRDDQPGASSRLPQRAHDGTATQLVILWRIVDCSRLVEKVAPTVTLRTAVGTSTVEPLSVMAGPAFDYATLVTAGVCPAR